jgi:hypothetical protein
MTGLQTRSLALVSLVAFALPIGGALAAGAGAGALAGERHPAESVEDPQRVR